MIRSGFVHMLPVAVSAGAAAGCVAAHEPSAPTELHATGSLNHMHLRWTGAESDAYDVYRSSNGSDFVRVNASPVVATSYDDPIDSPGGDGVWYRYQVTVASDPGAGTSNIAGGMHGTRLAASYPEGFGTLPEGSPYIAERGTIAVDGDLWISPGTKLYVLEGATIDFRGAGHRVLVDGELRAVGSASAPATFTAHRRDGGYLADREGLRFVFAGPPYDPEHQSGSLLDHVQLTNLAPATRIDRQGPLNILGTGVAFQHVKLTLNGGGRESEDSRAMVLAGGGWIILRNCFLDDLLLSITADLRDTPFEVSHSVFRGGGYSIRFARVASPAVRPGQIDSNDLDGLLPARLLEVSGTAAIPLGNNYWGFARGRQQMSVHASGSTATLDLEDPGTMLDKPPLDAGPDW